MNHSNLLPTLLLLLCAPALVAAGAEHAAPPPVQATLPADVDTLGANLFLESGSTGMVLIVEQGDKVVFHGYGETAPGSHQAPGPDSLLRLCSLTKIFTTDVLTKLVRNRTVRLDDPLQLFAPPHITVPTHAAAITLEDLATHTSGLPRELGPASPGTPHFTFPDYQTRWRWLPNVRLGTTPGTAALYSNVAFDLLSDALAAATHTQYAALLDARTLGPLHMWQTTFFPDQAQCSRLLISAHDEGPCTATEATAGSSGLYSTPGDMALWLRYLLGTGAASQNPAAQAVYLAPSHLLRESGLDHAGEPTGIGLGWIHILPVDDPSHIIQKTGGGAGFQTYIAINHARRTAIFVAATDGAVSAHVNLFNAANKLLLAVAGLPPLPEPPPKAPARHHQPSRREGGKTPRIKRHRGRGR